METARLAAEQPGIGPFHLCYPRPIPTRRNGSTGLRRSPEPDVRSHLARKVGSDGRIYVPGGLHLHHSVRMTGYK